MGFHDSGRQTTKMKEELLEQGELETVRLTLLAQEEERPQPVLRRPAVTIRIQDVAENIRVQVARVRALTSKYAEPAAHYLAPAVGILAPVAAVFRSSFLPKASKTKTLRKTAYLDGMRGFAALLVYILHHELWAHAMYGGEAYLENAFSFNDDYYIAALPGIRTFFSGGHLAVCTFFVLSGYVLSLKPLTLINKGEFLALGDSISSALFRRWLRLYIPIFVVTFFVLLTPWATGIKMTHTPQGSLVDDIWKWYCDLKNMTFIFDQGGLILLDYHSHTWSIPVEFKGSIVIFTASMAFSRATRTMRLVCMCGLWFYFMYVVDGAHFAMFMAGMIICNLEMDAEQGQLPGWMNSLKPFKTYIMYTLFVISIWWGGVPSNKVEIEHLRASPGWYWLSFLKPQAVFDYRWFFLHWSAALLVACTPHISWLKRFFECRFNQHLGRVSYMFYLVHGPVLWTLGDRLYAATGWVNYEHPLTIPHWMNKFLLPKWGIFGAEISFLVPNIILLPLTLWLAELLTTILDDNSIRFTSWLYKQILPAPSKSEGRDVQKGPGSPKTEA